MIFGMVSTHIFSILFKNNNLFLVFVTIKVKLLAINSIETGGTGTTGLGGEARGLDQIINAGNLALQQQQQLLLLQQQQQHLQQQLQQQQQLGTNIGSSNLGSSNLGNNLGASNLGSLSSLLKNNAGLSSAGGLTPVQQPGVITNSFFGGGESSHGDGGGTRPGSPFHVAGEYHFLHAYCFTYFQCMQKMEYQRKSRDKKYNKMLIAIIFN